MPSSARYGGQPFGEQVSFFRQKVNVRTRAWTDIYTREHDIGFMVAGAAKASLVNDFRGAIDRAISSGSTLQDFRKDFDGIVKRHGWAYQGGRNWRTRVIYETNLRQSYHAGREAQMADPALRRLRPYGLYRHGGSDEPRPEHQEKDGMVVRLDDPWWDVWSPQNGWGCSCKKFMLSEEDVQRQGLTVTESPPIGEMESRTIGVRGPTPRQVLVPKGIDPGFEHRPGALDRRSMAANQVLRRISGMDAGVAAQAAAGLLGRDSVLGAITDQYQRWARDSLEGGQAGGRFTVVGVLSPAVLNRLQERGVKPATAGVLLSDRRLHHLNRDAKNSRGAALSVEQIMRLPEMLARPQAVLWDTESPALLFVFPAPGGRDRGKIVVRVDEPEKVRLAGQRASVDGNWISTAGLVQRGNLSPPRYEPLWGEL